MNESRRIAAIILPDLVCELAAAALGVERAVHDSERAAHAQHGRAHAQHGRAHAQHGRAHAQHGRARSARNEPRPRPRSAARVPPLGVVLTDAAARARAEPIQATSLLDAVNAEARRYGVREGQSIAEACVLVANLAVRALGHAELDESLGRIAEIALGFGATVAYEAPDTVWVDVTGAAHLFGGEAALGSELLSRVRALGHVARVAIAPGPRIAQALGRWGDPALGASGERGVTIVSAERAREALGALPVAALPIAREHAAWLVRLGVLTLRELANIPRASAAARLGERASVALDLAEGKDEAPLAAYQPPTLLAESTTWDEPVHGSEPLSFVLRGLAARVSARLGGRGEAAQKLVLVILGDPAIARHRGVSANQQLVFDLASPLWREEEIRRVVGSRLERMRLETPSVGLRLEAPAIIRALGRQLDFSRVSAGVTASTGIETLPVLVAELGADIGKDRLGVLALTDSHRPEKKCALRPALAEPQAALAQKKGKPALLPIRKVRPRSVAFGTPSRWLPAPLPLEVALRVGATLCIEHRLYTIEQVSFVERLDAVEWWTGAPVARDYVQLWLAGVEGGLEAFVYVDRTTGKRFLHAIAD